MKNIIKSLFLVASITGISYAATSTPTSDHITCCQCGKLREIHSLNRQAESNIKKGIQQSKHQLNELYTSTNELLRVIKSDDNLRDLIVTTNSSNNSNDFFGFSFFNFTSSYSAMDHARKLLRSLINTSKQLDNAQRYLRLNLDGLGEDTQSMCIDDYFDDISHDISLVGKDLEKLKKAIDKARLTVHLS